MQSFIEFTHKIRLHNFLSKSNRSLKASFLERLPFIASEPEEVAGAGAGARPRGRCPGPGSGE